MPFGYEDEEISFCQTLRYSEKINKLEKRTEVEDND